MSPERSPLLDRHGAVPAEAPDQAVPAHYGDPLREQRRLARSTPASPVLVDSSHLGVVEVTGQDRASWLTTLSSQVLTGLPAGSSAELALLSAQGRLEYVPHAIIGEDRILLIVEPGQEQPLTAFLDSMRFMLRVQVRAAAADWAVVGLRVDPRDAAVLAPFLARAGESRLPLVWRDPWPGVVPGGTSYAAVAEHPGAQRTWYEALVPRERLPELAGLAEADPAPLGWAGLWAAEALRIEEWRPRAAREIDERAIPHELDLMRTAVHLAKGCYKGQETVARVHNLGHPPRRLAFLDLDGSEHTLPALGSPVYAEGGTRAVGRVTSAALHHEAGPIALAVLKRSVDPAAALRVVDPGQPGEDGEPAETVYAAAQTVIVDPEAGQVAGRRHRADFLRQP
ncbi:folate-binding protein [Rothia kristinae]|uniref:CAF17-like 4Fe-4S cluster assembly/insertion protein YgfZ n=1 Tax=Rothia kristinae TaxID=37923 RepID=UPI00342142D9